MAQRPEEVGVAPSASPTVRRRRLAAELRRLRGSRTAAPVAKALGWSIAKISRYENGAGNFPIDEIARLLEFYEVPKSRLSKLLALAEDANQSGWWEQYADSITPEYMEFIGLEAEAISMDAWQVESVPGLLQTPEYARAIHVGYQRVVLMPPGDVERRVEIRMARQRVLTERNPPLKLSAVVDESALLRKVGRRELMSMQLHHLADMAQLPNVELRVLPLQSDTAIMADSFVMFGFSAQDETGKLGDVVCTESLKSELYVEGETDTYVYRLFFEALADLSLSPAESAKLIRDTADRVWG
jgi:transcriptional regulator with XRE-family HTH domain